MINRLMMYFHSTLTMIKNIYNFLRSKLDGSCLPKNANALLLFAVYIVKIVKYVQYKPQIKG